MRERFDRREFFARSVVCGGSFTALGAVCRDTRAGAPGPRTPRQFELGTVTYNIAKDWDLETLISKCEALEIKAVELRTTHKHGVEPEISSAAREDVRKRFEKTAVRLQGLGSTCEFHSPKAEVVKQNIERTGAFIRLAHDVGAAGVKVRPNGLATKEGVPIETTLKQIGHALAECGKTAEPLGIEVWLEVHGQGSAHPPHIRQIMDACAHPAVGITWNSNPTDVKDGSVREYFDLLKRDIRSVHINELWRDYPYRELFALLRALGYDRYTMAEIPDSREPDRLLRYYRKLWDELSRPG